MVGNFRHRLVRSICYKLNQSLFEFGQTLKINFKKPEETWTFDVVSCLWTLVSAVLALHSFCPRILASSIFRLAVQCSKHSEKIAEALKKTSPWPPQNGHTFGPWPWQLGRAKSAVFFWPSRTVDRFALEKHRWLWDLKPGCLFLRLVLHCSKKWWSSKLCSSKGRDGGRQL